MEDSGSRLRLIWPLVVAAIAALVALLDGFHLAEGVIGNKPLLSNIAVLYLFVLITLMVGYATYRVVQTIKKERYANITVHVHSAHHNIRNLITYMNEHQAVAEKGGAEFQIFREHCVEKFNTILDAVAYSYTLLTGTNCRACIKTIYVKDRVPHLQRFARDRRSYTECFDLDEHRLRTSHDLVSENSEFRRMMEIKKDAPGDWYYFCNNIERDKNLRSTSISAYDHDFGNRFRRNWWQRIKDDGWRLPYRSTIATAIGQAPTPDIRGPEAIVLGFLAVDSESRDVFSRRWDVQLLYSFGDALFHPLERYLRVFNQVAPSGH